jgi:hypothetical protein
MASDPTTTAYFINPPIICVSTFVLPTVAKQELDKNITAETSTYATNVRRRFLCGPCRNKESGRLVLPRGNLDSNLLLTVPKSVTSRQWRTTNTQLWTVTILDRQNTKHAFIFLFSINSKITLSSVPNLIIMCPLITHSLNFLLVPEATTSKVTVFVSPWKHNRLKSILHWPSLFCPNSLFPQASILSPHIRLNIRLFIDKLN